MRFSLFFILFFPLWSCLNTEKLEQGLQLMYKTPAKVWEETLPLGNGRIGMMPDGGIFTETIVLNDITMWSGSEDRTALNPMAIKHLPKIRELLLRGENTKAQELMYKYFRCGGKGSALGAGKDAPYGCFQMLGALKICYKYSDKDSVKNYQRRLLLNEAIATTVFEKADVTFSREYFASHNDDVLIIRLRANKKEKITFDMVLSRPECAVISAGNNTLTMEGQLNDGYGTDKGVRYFTKIQVVNKGGTLVTKGNMLSLGDADEALIIVSTSTNMQDNNYKNNVEKLLSKSKSTGYKNLKNSHIEKYQEKFNRVELDLGKQDTITPTDERLKKFRANNDPSFAALYFQYGRYLMICGTREDSMPLNLQGLWANTTQTPWNGDYHLNINVQMNYWPVEVCNLSELHKPFLRFTQSLVSSGESTAKTFYGTEGWVAHVISNPWHFTAPGEHASWGATITGGAWLCEHLWEHYAFTQDKDYLKSVYPTLKGAADFFLANLIEEPNRNWLVTAPSSSPENGFYPSSKKEVAFVCMAPTMDMQIINELFSNTLKAAEILGIQDKSIQKIKTVLPKLPPMQISPKGYLQEWLEDYREVEVQHRHVSHLYGLYPSNQISPELTPKLAKAAHQTLERRGDGGTGWSRAWKVNFWARLYKGNRAYKLLKNLLKPAFDESGLTKNGGTYPNLFCAHPPFQIDGNFGGTAGIAEMLIQSQNGYIVLLPALPEQWSEGSFKGLRVRGGAEVDAVWENREIKKIVLRATTSNIFKVKIPHYIRKIKNQEKELKIKDGFATIKINKNKTVALTFY